MDEVLGSYLNGIIHEMRQQKSATIAAAIVSASGKPHSIEQALGIMDDVHWAMYPDPTKGAYTEWAKTKDARVKKVHTSRNKSK
jgi:hypothetical protein